MGISGIGGSGMPQFPSQEPTQMIQQINSQTQQLQQNFGDLQTQMKEIIEEMNQTSDPYRKTILLVQLEQVNEEIKETQLGAAGLFAEISNLQQNTQLTPSEQNTLNNDSAILLQINPNANYPH